jgi:hypothetical protein
MARLAREGAGAEVAFEIADLYQAVNTRDT